MKITDKDADRKSFPNPTDKAWHNLILRIKRIERNLEQNLKWRQEDNIRIAKLEDKIKCRSTNPTDKGERK